MRKFISFLSGTIMGALVGATFALLLAPESGETLRIQLQERLDVLKGEISAASTNRRTELENQLAKLRKPKK